MANKNAAQTLAELQPRSAYNVILTVIAATVNTPRPLPPLVVPPGCSVVLAGYTGASTNSSVIYVGTDPIVLKTGQGVTVIPPSNSPKDGVVFAVDNLNQIWWMAADNGDGLTVTVAGPSVG